MNSYPKRSFLALLSCALFAPALVPAEAPPSFAQRAIEPQTDYERTAQDAYGEGYALIERATRFEHDAATAASETARSAAIEGARVAFEDALAAFETAVREDERMYEAHTYLGYANRKLGRFEAALAAYAEALQLKPDYAHAIEYQGEAYLGLDRFAAAKNNYLRLYALDEEQASKLLVAMNRWVEQRRAQASGSAAAALEEATQWVRAQPAAPLKGTELANPW